MPNKHTINFFSTKQLSTFYKETYFWMLMSQDINAQYKRKNENSLEKKKCYKKKSCLIKILIIKQDLKDL